MLGVRLGAKAIRHEFSGFVFATMALAAVLGPLLVLWGLRNGVVDSVLGALRANPATLEIQFRGHASLAERDLARIAALPGIGFLVPDISSIAAEVVLRGPRGPRLVRAEAWPTADGDPLRGPDQRAPAPTEVALSATLAASLDAGVGDSVTLLRQRGSESRPEQIEMPLRVVAISAPERILGARAFLHGQTIDRLQAFVDGYAVPGLTATGTPLAQRPAVRERIRLYARSLEDVAPLAAAMTALGFDVTSRAAEVETVFDLDRNLSLLFALLAGMGAIGYLISMGANLAAALGRRRRELSLLRLLGAQGGDLVGFALAQGVAIAVIGVALSFVAYAGLASIINARFPSGAAAATACRLTPADIALAIVASTAMVGLVTLIVARPLTRIAPSEVLREA